MRDTVNSADAVPATDDGDARDLYEWNDIGLALRFAAWREVTDACGRRAQAPGR